MKRKILSVLAVLVAVLMSTAVLTACDKTPAGAENASGSGESVSTEQGGDEKHTVTEETGYTIDENRFLSAKIVSFIPEPPEWYYERLQQGAVVDISFSVPTGWDCVPLYDAQNELSGLSFTSDSFDKSDGICRIFIYEGDGSIYERLTEHNFTLIHKDENSYFKIEAPYAEAASYVLTYFSGRQGDSDESQPSYLRSYQLQFDGYVVDCYVFINANDSDTLSAEEAACDDFIASIKLF